MLPQEPLWPPRQIDRTRIATDSSRRLVTRSKSAEPTCRILPRLQPEVWSRNSPRSASIGRNLGELAFPPMLVNRRLRIALVELTVSVSLSGWRILLSLLPVFGKGV